MLVYKRILYFVAKLISKTDSNRIVFESFQGRSYACNPKGIYEAMILDTAYQDFKYTWVFRDINKGNTLISHEKTNLVKFESFGYYKALASAKYWIFNSNTRSFLKPGKEQVFVQTWHGTPLKKIGCDVVKEGNAVTKVSEIPKIYNTEAKKISYMISPSAYCTEKLISAFHLDAYGKQDAVLEIGYPRNDSLFTFEKNKVNRIKEKLGIKEDKKVILYAPTFRDHKHSPKEGFSLEIGIDFEQLKNQLYEEYVVLFRAHYFIARQMNLKKYEGFVYDVSNINDVNELYVISDMLITDYSSVFFDYANLRRPMFFFMYDYDEYKNQVRDLYFDISELPGPIVHCQEELVRAIKEYNLEEWKEQYQRFHEKYNYLDGPDCGKKAAQIIIRNEKIRST